MLLVLLSIISVCWGLAWNWKLENQAYSKMFCNAARFFSWIFEFSNFHVPWLVHHLPVANAPEWHTWTRGTMPFFLNASNSSDVLVCLMSHAKKIHASLFPLLPNDNGFGGPAVLENNGESTSHEKPCRASPTLGILPLAPKGGLTIPPSCIFLTRMGRS
jgi:hypothetical protein